MFFLVINIYKNIPTDEKIKLYLRFCDYIAKEQIEDGKDGNQKEEVTHNKFPRHETKTSGKGHIEAEQSNGHKTLAGS